MALGDVRDVRGFVATVLRGLDLDLDADEFEELLDAGVLEACELHATYRPDVGTFEGYLSRYLGGRLRSAWHRTSENHSRPGNGRLGEPRPWMIAPKAVSLEAAMVQPGFDERRLSPAVHHRRRQQRAKAAPLTP